MKRAIWVVDDDQSMTWVIEKALVKQGYQVTVFCEPRSLLAALRQSTPELIISDIRMPGMSGFDLLAEINTLTPAIPTIIMTAFGDLDSAVDSYKYGAFEYLTKPFDLNELTELVGKAIKPDSLSGSLEVPSSDDTFSLLGESPAMQEVFRKVGRLSASNMGVLIRGESGTGKELIAKAIHQTSPRKGHALIAINTAAIPTELLESELFGHEKGAFTGAVQRHIGRFEQAHNGTLFLDEIGDMPAALQTRLLRVLSEGRFYRVGGREEISVDVRVIAATNQHLETLVQSGRFRNDLFHRLNVIALSVPPLRERVDDIPQLVRHFLKKAMTELGLEKKNCHPDVIRQMQNYEWPGNVRELENLIYRLIVLTAGNQIRLSDLPPEITRQFPSDADGIKWQVLLLAEARKKMARGETALIQSMGAEFERMLTKAALEYTGGHRINAAQILGWGRNTLTRKLIHWKQS